MAYTANKLKSRLAARLFHHDPADATVATKIGWVAMGESFMAIVQLASGTGLLTVKVFAATDSSGTGAAEVTAGAHADPTVADAAGDQVVVEVDQAQVQAALSGATHVSVEVDCDAVGDIADIAYIVAPKVLKNGNTADIIA
jgi:hypothetical protein